MLLSLHLLMVQHYHWYLEPRFCPSHPPTDPEDKWDLTWPRVCAQRENSQAHVELHHWFIEKACKKKKRKQMESIKANEKSTEESFDQKVNIHLPLSKFTSRSLILSLWKSLRVVQYCDIMRFMILCDRYPKVSPNSNPWQNSNGFAMHEERYTLWHFVISIVKYRESHYVTVLDMHVHAHKHLKLTVV